MRKFSAFIAGVGLLIGIAGCAGTPDAAPTGTATSSAPPSAQASADPEPVTSIVIAGDAIRFYSGGTERETVAFTDPLASALGAVADALGPQTGTRESAGSNHTVPVTFHQFGDVSIVEFHYDGVVENDPLVTPSWAIRSTTARMGGVSLATGSGLTIGSSIDEIPGHADADRVSTFTSNGATSAYVLAEASPGSRLIPSDAGIAVGVLAAAERFPGPITQLSAPAQFGGA